MSSDVLIPDPFDRFADVFAEAERQIPTVPNAVVLATVDPDGRPSARVVLLKHFDARGFVFYTNLQSRKGRALEHFPHAALCFHWPVMEKQVRIEGAVERVSDAEADAYFVTRPRGSQIGAWASRQSETMTSREALEARYEKLEREFEGKDVTRPPFWSGFRVRPDRFEFWTGRESRLHERERYVLEDGNRWRIERLFP